MKIHANGIAMNYELAGEGRCLALIHGAGDNLHMWYNQVPAFSQQYRVLTYDVRGFGETEFPETDVRLLAASRRDTLQRVAVTLLGLSEESLNAILGAACRMRRLEALPTPD